MSTIENAPVSYRFSARAASADKFEWLDRLVFDLLTHQLFADLLIAIHHDFRDDGCGPSATVNATSTRPSFPLTVKL